MQAHTFTLQLRILSFKNFLICFNISRLCWSINGDDSIELYENGQIIDTFGDVDTDGSGQDWDYVDGWAYRSSGTGPEWTTFTPSIGCIVEPMH